MRLDALRRVLYQRARVKIFVALEDRCLCGYSSRQTATGPELVVKVGASVQVDFATRTITERPFFTGALVLSDKSKVTRRIQTHRHHLAGRDIPEQYFIQAMAL